jgi:hypothetical protein
MSVGKSEAYERCFTQVGFELGWKGLPRTNPSLLRTFVNYGREKFYTIATRMSGNETIPMGPTKNKKTNVEDSPTNIIAACGELPVCVGVKLHALNFILKSLSLSLPFSLHAFIC